MSSASDNKLTDFQKLKQLSWELALWLPGYIYKEMMTSVKSPNIATNELTVIIAIRKFLLGKDAGKLVADHVALHGLGIDVQKP
jgi:hypothetical protein